ncbi:autotransporter family protein, partial [Fusobacterium ulcerans]|uniref:autotransporter family protein n=1 Tax=Fusobacterium ulcerans TaxID=861 RepID=UPI0011C3802A
IIAGTTPIYRNSYGIYNDGGTIGTLTNNGIITGTSTSGAYGIYNEDGTIGTLTNNGVITGTSSTSIYNYSSTIEILLNNGIITGATSTSGNGYGINNDRGTTIGTLTNNGVITRATSTHRNGYGIYNNDTTIEILLNNGVITGTSTSGNGYGIYNKENASIPAVENTGIIYGKTNAVFNGGGETGKVKRTNNYGLLISGSTNVVDGISIVAHDAADNDNEIKNYGLAFTDDGSGSYKNHGASDANHNFGKTWDATIDGVAYKIRNVEADVNSTGGAITNIKSFKIEGGELYSDTTKINDSNSTSNVILNGITDTLLVSTGENKLDNSVINAYGTAVKFDNAGGNLTLSGTTVNGGIDGTSYVIAGGSGDDTLTLKNGTTINGTIDGGTGNDTLNFGSAVTRAVANDGINIQHSISGFEKMNINTNVTLFEKTIAADGSVADLQVTGVTDVTIGAKGVLTLRIDSANGNKHALSSTGSTGTIKSENGGKLLLALNGAGLRETISFGNLTLDESLVTAYDGEYQEDVTFETTSVFHSVKRTSGTNEVEIEAKKNLPSRPSGSDELSYEKLNKIYQSLCSPLVNGLENFNVDDDEKLSIFLGYLNDIYAGNPYSYSSELSRKSAGMFRDIVTENIFKPETNKWMIYGGLTHVDGGTKDTYYGKGYYTYDIGSSDMDADTKITGAYMLGEYGVSDTLTSGVVIGGNKLKSDLSNGSKVDGSALYLGAYAKKYIGNLKVTAGAGFQYGDYDADRIAVNRVASDSAEPVMKYSDNYNDITYDIYLNGRYSHNIGDNLFLEPYGTLSYTYIDQDGANEGSKTLAIETDSKSFDYTVGKVGVDLKKVIPHEKGKSILSAGVSYTKILDGADEEHITGRFKGGTDFDILVAHKNEHSIGLNAKYALELENGVLFDVKGTYSVERDSNNNSGKNKTKGEWIVGAGIGYKF